MIQNARYSNSHMTTIWNTHTVWYSDESDIHVFIIQMVTVFQTFEINCYFFPHLNSKLNFLKNTGDPYNLHPIIGNIPLSKSTSQDRFTYNLLYIKWSWLIESFENQTKMSGFHFFGFLFVGIGSLLYSDVLRCSCSIFSVAWSGDLKSNHSKYRLFEGQISNGQNLVMVIA